jgi:serine beta-lactamase-like protein LACTB
MSDQGEGRQAGCAAMLGHPSGVLPGSASGSPGRLLARPGLAALAFSSVLALMLAGCATFDAPVKPAEIDAADVRAADIVMAGLADNFEDRLPGYASAVGVGEQIVYSRAAGLADIESGRAATPRTRFRIYSASKTMGATAAMMLAESGRLDLDAPVSTYLPDLPAEVGRVTVRQILAHRSGIRHYRDGEWDRVSDSNCAGPGEALADFVGDPLEFAPGSDYRYTTFGYVLLSAVVEAAARQPFDDFVRERIFEPAGMTATAIEGRPLDGFDVASFYDRDDAGEFSLTAGIDASCKFFGGGLVSTAEDMVRFGLALVNGKLVKASSLHQMLTVHSEGGGNYPPYGYGFIPGDGLTTTFEVPLEDYVPNWWHGGNGRGGYSVLMIYPERRSAAAIATNVRASGRLVRATHMLAVPFLRD